jgi:hypothetical protein
MNIMYGLSKDDIKIARLKLKSKDFFLANNYLSINGEKIALSNFTKSQYVNPMAYASELFHRVESMIAYSKDYKLINLMCTFTLPAHYREGNTNATTKECAGELRNMFTTIRDDRAWKEIPKEKRVFFSVIEPHLDGLPHMHVSIWIPAEYVDRILRAIHRKFPAPLVDVASTFIPETYHLSKNAYRRNGKWNEAYIADDGQEGYVRKLDRDTTIYIIKTFIETVTDIKKGIVTPLLAWFIVNQITRFSTSRTLIPLTIYRALNGRYTLNVLTRKYNAGDIVVLQNERKENRIIIDNKKIIWKKKDWKKNSGTCCWTTKEIYISGETIFNTLKSLPKFSILHFGYEISYVKKPFSICKELLPYGRKEGK